MLSQTFGTPVIDLQKVRTDTALQRAVLQHIKNGKHWCGGGSVMFPEDLDWGKQVYRNASFLGG